MIYYHNSFQFIQYCKSSRNNSTYFCHFYHQLSIFQSDFKVSVINHLLLLRSCIQVFQLQRRRSVRVHQWLDSIQCLSMKSLKINISLIINQIHFFRVSSFLFFFSRYIVLLESLFHSIVIPRVSSILTINQTNEINPNININNEKKRKKRFCSGSGRVRVWSIFFQKSYVDFSLISH